MQRRVLESRQQMLLATLHILINLAPLLPMHIYPLGHNSSHCKGLVSLLKSEGIGGNPKIEILFLNALKVLLVKITSIDLENAFGCAVVLVALCMDPHSLLLNLKVPAPSSRRIRMAVLRGMGCLQCGGGRWDRVRWQGLLGKMEIMTIRFIGFLEIAQRVITARWRLCWLFLYLGSLLLFKNIPTHPLHFINHL